MLNVNEVLEYVSKPNWITVASDTEINIRMTAKIESNMPTYYIVNKGPEVRYAGVEVDLAVVAYNKG